MHRKILFQLVIILFVLLQLSCSKFPQAYNHTSKKYLIGFSQCNTDDLWRQTMISEMRLEASFHPEISLVIHDGQRNTQKQIEDIEDLISLKVDVLIVSPNEARPITPVLEKAYRLGIPVILIDRKINSDKYSVFIGADNYKIGYEAGKYAYNILNGKGKIFEITGLKGSSPAMERHQGFLESIKSTKQIEIINGGDGRWFSEYAEKLINEALKKDLKFDLVYAHNDVMALGAYNVIKKFRGKKDVFIIGIDALPGNRGGIQMVIDKVLDATLLYPTGGDIAIQTALDILNEKPYKKEIKLETVLVDSSNARVLKMQSDQVLNQQKKIEAQREILKEQSSEIEAQQVRLYISLVVLSIILAISVLLLRSYRIIKKINHELEKKNQSIIKQKEEISLQRDQILEMSNELKKVNDSKIEFFTNISHEFRTPLTLIISSIHKILSGKHEKIDFTKRINNIKKNAERLHYLINQLLDFRKLDEKKMHLHAERHKIVPFLENIINVFYELADEKKIELKFEFNDPDVELWFDDEKLDKIIFNLLSNAFKFTSEGGKILITCKQEFYPDRIEPGKFNEGFVEINLTDTGIGIPQEEISKIFEPFYEIKHKLKTRNIGTGIGLALSKSLIELHHGEISLDSVENKGTKITIRIPLGEAHLTLEEKVFTKNSIDAFHNSAEVIDLFVDDNVEKTALEINNLINVSKPTLLVVEDNIELVSELRQFFSKDYNLKYAENGKEGLKLAFQLIPDIIVCDIMMPVMDGIQMCGELKNDTRTSHIPIILLTAKSTDDNLIEGFETGADDYITKPFNPRLLESRIKNLISLRKKLKDYFTQDISFFFKEKSIKDVDKTFLEKVISYIEKNLINPEMNVEKIGEELGLTRVHLYRKIKSLTGYSVSEFIRVIKLNKAIELMRESELSVSEVAFRVGFETPSYFTKCFKEIYNMTPSEYLSKQTNIS